MDAPDAVMGTMSVSDPEAAWSAPDMAEKLMSSVPGAGVSSLAGVDAQIAAWRSEILAGHEGSDTEGEAAEALAELLTTQSVASAGVVVVGGSLASNTHATSFTGMVPSHSGATPAPRQVVRSIEEALNQAADEASEASAAKAATVAENRK
jgi:hypothetical protein